MTIHPLSSQSSSAAVAAALGKKTFSDRLRSLVERIAAAVVAIFHYIKERFTPAPVTPIAQERVSLPSVKTTLLQEIYLLLDKQGKQADFDIESELKTEKKQPNPVLADPNKKPWMFQQFYKDMIKRNHHLLKIISKGGSLLFDKTQGPEGVIRAFDKLFSQRPEMRELVQVLSMQNLQMPFSLALMDITQKTGIDGFSTTQKAITLTEEADDRFHVSWIYDVDAAIEGQKTPVGAYEFVSTLHRSQGRWTVFQEIRKASSASLSSPQPTPSSRGWVGAALAVAAVAVALGLYVASRSR